MKLITDPQMKSTSGNAIPLDVLALFEQLVVLITRRKLEEKIEMLIEKRLSESIRKIR